MASVLSLQGVTKRYQAGVAGCFATVDVLRAVHLDVAEGEVLGLVGPVRSGKTTLMLCAAGLLRPDAGRVIWFERDDPRQSGRPPGVAFIGSTLPSYAFLTVRQALVYHATLDARPGGRADGDVDDALRSVALEPEGSTRVAHLSRAATGRFAIARAILSDPRLLLVDGALDDLDSDARDDLSTLLAGLARSGVGVVLASSHRQVAEGAANRVVHLVGGELRGVARGPAGEVTTPARTRVAESARASRSVDHVAGHL
jgi:ABC-type multidrug transport system ATPase subunit